MIRANRPGPPAVWVALWRGVNVGGHNRLPMADLRALLAELGAEEVATYVQSGNAVYRAAPGSLPTDAVRLRAAVAERTGTDVPVLVLDGDRVVSAARRHPLAATGRDDKLLMVALTADAPGTGTAVTLAERVADGEEVAVDGHGVWLWYGNGSGRSGLTLDRVERAAGTTAAVRNWRTVRALADLVAERT